MVSSVFVVVTVTACAPSGAGMLCSVVVVIGATGACVFCFAAVIIVVVVGSTGACVFCFVAVIAMLAASALPSPVMVSIGFAVVAAAPSGSRCLRTSDWLRLAILAVVLVAFGFVRFVDRAILVVIDAVGEGARRAGPGICAGRARTRRHNRKTSNAHG